MEGWVLDGRRKGLPLAQTSSILRNSRANHLPELRKLPLQIRRRSLKEQVSNIDSLVRLGLESRPLLPSRSILKTERARSLLRDLRDSLGGRLECLGRLAAVEAAEGRDHNALVADREGCR